MGIQVRTLDGGNEAVLQCTTTNYVLPLVIEDETAEMFLDYLPRDARHYSSTELYDLYMKFLTEINQIDVDQTLE